MGIFTLSLSSPRPPTRLLSRSLSFGLLLLSSLLGPLLRAGEAADLRLIPFPKEIHRQPGALALDQALVFQAPAAHGELLGRLLNEELQRAKLPPASMQRRQDNAFWFTLSIPDASIPALPLAPGESAEGYALSIGPRLAACSATGPAGLFYGLQTLRQLIRANREGTTLPGLAIRDWPSLRWRAFQDDMTRGPSSTLDTLKYEAELGVFLKFNLMTFYMEYQYAFQKHPQIGPPDGSLTPEELAALVAHLAPLPLDLLGNQQSFGHFTHILKHPEFAGLRETPYLLSPAEEGTYQLLDDLYAEVCPLLPFPWFNVCCDETWGLGEGPSKELAAQIGVGGVYVNHIRRVHQLLQKYDKRMMMWGDIILQHPDHLESVPKDVIMLTWGYDARPSFEDQILPFAQSGYEFFVCPGVNNWSRILPDFGVAMTNIRHFVRDGVKHGALGMLNTDWEDDGEAINAVKWHADAWAAECAWNAAATPPEDFQRRVGAVLFGEAGHRFGRAIERLAHTHRLPDMLGMNNQRFWQDDFAPRRSPAAIQSSASNLLALVQPALADLEACRQEAVVNRPILEALLLGAHRMERIGQRMLDGLKAAQLYQEAWALSSDQEGAAPASARHDPGRLSPAALLTEAEKVVRENRDAHQALQESFTKLWLSESKPYALDWTTQRYQAVQARYDELLKNLAQARRAAEAHRPLPSPEAIGLALPEVFGRRSRPSEVQAVPLHAEVPWAEPSATHRLGVRVLPASHDRFELPVEVEVSLPRSLVDQPIRAYQLVARNNADPALREIPAQLDPAPAGGKPRLVALLRQGLAQETEGLLHVYLGLATPPPALPESVSMRPGPAGMFWIENDHVRALLGSEGAHVYRWEVKASQDRDLTQPGESGWAGFADMATHRGTPYQLTCVANGPALVRFQAVDRAGATKTISLYAGASWFEVILSDPTSIFWNFDTPQNFAADGPTPGTYLFSNGDTGPVKKEADGVPGQVKARDVFWGIKFNADKLALGLITPEVAAHHHVAPGSGAGGAGIESSVPANHFITFAGPLTQDPAIVMERLRHTLDLRQQPAVVLHSLQNR